jgi:hypothetical protein
MHRGVVKLANGAVKSVFEVKALNSQALHNKLNLSVVFPLFFEPFAQKRRPDEILDKIL